MIDRYAPPTPTVVIGQWELAAKERDAPVERAVLADEQPRALFADIVGHVDLCGPDLVEGWIFWSSKPNQKLQLDIIIAGELLGRCDANLFRPDLQQAGYADGRCAFSFPIPRAVTVRDFATARARLANSLLYLLPDSDTILWRGTARAGTSKLTAVEA